jgi:6-hydroxycyclohex-1-ene-1-carbonyl-CoA dehydrogenase
MLNADLRAGDVAVFVGVGGVGLFGVQIARALGAHVVALDVDPIKVERGQTVGAEFTRRDRQRRREGAIKAELKAWAKEQRAAPRTVEDLRDLRAPWPARRLAFSLLNHGAHLGRGGLHARGGHGAL